MTNSNNPSELREKAKLARRLASGASQDHTREYFLASAYGLEKLADAAQKGFPSDPNDLVNK
jgi:predicted Zn-dependent protease